MSGAKRYLKLYWPTLVLAPFMVALAVGLSPLLFSKPITFFVTLCIAVALIRLLACYFQNSFKPMGYFIHRTWPVIQDGAAKGGTGQ